MPPAPKNPARRQRRNASGLGLVPAGAPPTFSHEPPAGLAPAVLRQWDELWDDPLSATFMATDVDGLQRLFILRDEYARLMKSYRRKRLVEGSRGQVAINPLAAQMNVIAGQIKDLEDRFGLSPMARLKLGVKLGEAAGSLGALLEGIGEDDDDGDPRSAGDPRSPSDPRLSGIIDASSSDARTSGL